MVYAFMSISLWKKGRKVFLEVYNFTDSNKTKEAKKNHARVWNVQIFPFGVCSFRINTFHSSVAFCAFIA